MLNFIPYTAAVEIRCEFQEAVISGSYVEGHRTSEILGLATLGAGV